jgi:hypothetical protein
MSHQQNVIRSRSHTQTSQTLRQPTPVLLSTSRCSQPHLELCKMLSDSARAFSRASESTSSAGGAFRMLRDLTIMIVKFWSCGDLCTGLRETWCRILTPTTRYFIDHIGVCYGHKIRNIIIWHELSKSLYIYTFGDTGITEMDSATSSIYFGDPGVDRHHLIIRNTQCILPSFEVPLKMTIK